MKAAQVASELTEEVEGTATVFTASAQCNSIPVV